MSLWAFIPGSAIVSVGALPTSARRLDTGHEVVDLGGTGAKWRRACGWWDLDSPSLQADLLASGRTAAEVASLMSAAAAARSRRDARASWRGEVEDAVGSRGVLWDWLDDNASHVVIGSPLAGQNWPAGGTLGLLSDQCEVLRTGVTDLAIAAIAMSEAFEVLLPLLADAIAAADAVTPPI